MITKTRDSYKDPFSAADYEWLETNGMGGWAGSSITGMQTRRYHGLLVAATQPPTERKVLVSKLDETIRCGEESFALSTNDYGDVVFPEGYQYLASFTRNLFPEWIYAVRDIRLKKTISMIHGENSTLICYEVLDAPQSFTLDLVPLLAFRDYHAIGSKRDSFDQTSHFTDDIFSIKPYPELPRVYIRIPGSRFLASPDWYYHFHYAKEAYRGQDAWEDLFCPGIFSVSLQKGDKLGILLSTEEPAGRNIFECFEKERQRKQSLLSSAFTGTMDQYLRLAADQFIVKRAKNLSTVIAGYHWFTDWGRDTMIALQGLCLSTGRFADAKNILTAFADRISDGMLPNRFCDAGDQPEYNTADATLWFFVALHQYHTITGDDSFVNTMYPVLETIIQWHIRGTRYHIKVADDGLLYAGEPGVQLTWMDAKVGDWVVTPRTGKPVEIQALWYNALCIFLDLSKGSGQTEITQQAERLIQLFRENFQKKFWNPELNCLYDCLNEADIPMDEIRPNQVFAISLPYPLLAPQEALQVLDILKKHLVTPAGLRSLSDQDPKYQPVYGGDQVKRDGAYHQGTVWAWLMGPYIDAMIRYKTGTGYGEAATIISNFAAHLEEACLGSVSEIFDGDAPHHPRGCISQAWSVAELLRVIHQYRLDPAI
ncbi:MAG: glycogen debranching enzyme family protein [Bacteroidota bacterium]|nr:glycogen debranching enzyme family protein [Bacteroidota bacterium]